MMKLDELFATRNWVGKPIRRDHDIRFVKGEGEYVDDLPIECTHVAILRSIYAHARLGKVDTSKAERMPGVLAVITGEEVARVTKPVSAPRHHQARHAIRAGEREGAVRGRARGGHCRREPLSG